uniref:Uncharacterized protein n=1 Tax=Ditylenchus dipsaci TaxID=166011 RepID=A0A915E206_9BILA
MEDPGHTIPITALTSSLTKYTDVIIRGMWKELEQAIRLSDRRFSYTSWTRYKELRNSKPYDCLTEDFPTLVGHAIRNCELVLLAEQVKLLEGTCLEGIMDVVCKHSLMLMEAEKLIDPLPQPLEGRQKRGKKRKIGRA